MKISRKRIIDGESQKNRRTDCGNIKIEMQLVENGVRLVFEDNGIGFPSDVDSHVTQTFGLKLVQMLVKQLDGSIEQFLDSGTRYVIMFKPLTLGGRAEDA